MKNMAALICTTFLIPSFLFGDGTNEVGKGINYFYQAPTRQRFEQIQKEATEYEEKFGPQETNAGLLVSVMISRISDKHSWPIIGENKIAKVARQISGGKSEVAKYVSDDTQVDPTKLDIWWRSFFATGETKYLDKLLVYAGEEFPEGNMGKMLVVGAATWSFKLNCRQHDAIRKYAKECAKMNAYKHKKDYLKECYKKEIEPPLIPSR